MTPREYAGAYQDVVTQAKALEPGGSFLLERGVKGTYGGLFDFKTDPVVAAARVRIKLHQKAGAKKLGVRVRLAPDRRTIQVYRRKS